MLIKRQQPKPGSPSKSDLDREATLNERQRRLDAALDAWMYAECCTSPVRVIRPGDPEFDAIAWTVTPIGRIPDSCTFPTTTPLGRYYLLNDGFPARQANSPDGKRQP